MDEPNSENLTVVDSNTAECSEFSTEHVNNECEQNSGDPNFEKKAERDCVKLVQLPLARIKCIMKMDPDVNLASSDAVFAITKATELFIDSIAKEAYSYTAKARRKIITKKDLDTVVETVDCLCFLDGATDF